jgi:hypothetical protein
MATQQLEREAASCMARSSGNMQKDVDFAPFAVRIKLIVE